MLSSYLSAAKSAWLRYRRNKYTGDGFTATGKKRQVLRNSIGPVTGTAEILVRLARSVKDVNDGQ